jgi:hypothetical protein
MATLARFLQPPVGSLFLFGPRGTGKSTWLSQTFPRALTLNLLAPEVLRPCLARPERLRERLDAERDVDTVVIDEVHALVEKRPRLRFVLTGSSARYPEADRLLLSFCPEPLLIDGIRCEPIEPWLRALRPLSPPAPSSDSPSPGPASRSSSPGCS